MRRSWTKRVEWSRPSRPSRPRRRSLTILGGAALAVLALGCGGVLSNHPIGAAPLAVAENEWEGVWIGEDGPLHLRVVDAEGGILEVAWIETEAEGFVLESTRLELRHLEDWTIVSFRPEDDDDRYLWLRVEREGSRLTAWLPHEEAFAELVESGVLPGTVEEGNALLARLEPTHLARIHSGGGGLFHWDEPMVLRRLPD